jgi:hypothetical protein
MLFWIPVPREAGNRHPHKSSVDRGVHESGARRCR